MPEVAQAQEYFTDKKFVGKLVIDCTFPEPIPKEGEIMLKCNESPADIVWATDGVMKVASFLFLTTMAFFVYNLPFPCLSYSTLQDPFPLPAISILPSRCLLSDSGRLLP